MDIVRIRLVYVNSPAASWRSAAGPDPEGAGLCPNPTPRPSQDRGPLGVLFWMLVSAKTSAEQAAQQCEKALRQLDVIRREQEGPDPR